MLFRRSLLILVGASVIWAADASVGTRNLNVAKSAFRPGASSRRDAGIPSAAKGSKDDGDDNMGRPAGRPFNKRRALDTGSPRLLWAISAAY